MRKGWPLRLVAALFETVWCSRDTMETNQTMEQGKELNGVIPSGPLLIRDPFQCPDEVRNQDVNSVQVELKQSGRVDEDAGQDSWFQGVFKSQAVLHHEVEAS